MYTAAAGGDRAATVRQRQVVPVESFAQPMPDTLPSGSFAVFDLDRTLHAGSGLGVLARHAFRSGLIGPRRMGRSLIHDVVFRNRGSTDGHINSIAELALDMAGGTSLDDLEPVLAATADEIASSVRGDMAKRLDYHRESRHCCILLSASPQPLVERIGDLLGFDHGIGTVIEHDRGVLTGSIIPPMCYGEGKLRRLDQVMAWETGRFEAGFSYAYADSISDLPLLDAVDLPVVVAPDRKLKRTAIERAWSILEV